jgi:hypothetical protein
VRIVGRIIDANEIEADECVQFALATQKDGVCSRGIVDGIE